MAKYAAFGTQLRMGTSTSTGATTLIIGVHNMTGPGGDTEEIDVTAHDSTGSFRETLASFRDPGELNFDIRYDPAHASHNTATGIIGAWQDGVTRYWTMTLTDAASSVVEFFAWVKSFTMSSPFDGPLDASATLRLTGLPVFP